MRTLGASVLGWRRVAAMLVLPVLVAAGVGIAWVFRPESEAGSGRLVLVRDRSAIYVVNEDGSGLRRLRGSIFAPAGDPDWSPDGRRMVFAQSCRLYLMNGGGGGVRPLPAARGICAQHADWSPDGRRIAFSARDEGDAEVAAIAITDTRGSKPTLITQPDLRAARFDDLFPDWSPDGTRIAFARADHRGSSPGSPDPELFIVNADGTGLRKLPPEPTAEVQNMPVWSPDGSKLAHGLARGGYMSIYLTDPSGRHYENLSPEWPKVEPGSVTEGGMGGEGTLGERYPAWSADGSRIAFTTMNGIATMNPDGAERRVLTRSPFHDASAWQGSASASMGGMGMDWWPWWITSLAGLLVVAVAGALLVTARARLRLAAGAAVVIAAGLAIAAPVVMTSSGSGNSRGPAMEARK